MAFIFGTPGNDVRVGGAGDDLILGYDPVVPFPDGNDTLTGGAGNDSLYGGDGNDSLTGGTGNDSLYGGNGNDILNGNTGIDRTFGGNGNDRIIDDDAVNFDIHDGGAGIDTIDYSPVTFGAGLVTINLATSLTSVTSGNTETILNFENVEGSQGSETIIGSAASNLLDGNSGNDTINGASGNDTLIGGLGTDRMTDGLGNDIYRYFSVTESNPGVGIRDILTDFTQVSDDIDLSPIDSNLSIAGNQAFDFIGMAAFNGGGNGQVRYFQAGGNTIIQVDRQGDGNIIAEMEIQLTGLIPLAATDFFL
jgi:Ca2+-binding RTX toxin-like protein